MPLEGTLTPSQREQIEVRRLAAAVKLRDDQRTDSQIERVLAPRVGSQSAPLTEIPVSLAFLLTRDTC